ncbi:MAG: hypothetical protein IPP88_07085 [Betaproteobacteria bacterium]|nr:hypothetical protein [Betaproteobacteria bacterium]
MRFRRLLPMMAFAGCAMLACAPASAAVTAHFAAGKTCAGKPVASFSAGGPDANVTLCMSATEESICGHSIQLEAESVAASGQILVVTHKMGEHYPDPTLDKFPAPIAITQPPSPNDFGGTRDNPLKPSANQVLVLFTFRPLATAKDPSYTIRLGKNSLVSVGKNGSCLDNTEVPISASFKFERK